MIKKINAKDARDAKDAIDISSSILLNCVVLYFDLIQMLGNKNTLPAPYNSLNEIMFHCVLYEPEIPPNTGNIIRQCANTGVLLHLIHPLGFELEDKKLRRAGLDYHDLARVQEHESLSAFLETVQPARLFACSTKGKTCYADQRYQAGDAFLFGPETRGLPQTVLDHFPTEQVIRIPMQQGNRSMNLANAVAVILYEAWRQLDFRLDA